MDLLTVGFAISLHMGFQDTDHNQFHPFVEYRLDDMYSAGVMINSNDSISTYLMGRYQSGEKTTIDYAIVTGYKEYKLLPMIRYSYHFNDTVSFWAMPGYDHDNRGHGDSGLVVGTQIRFN